MMGGDGQNQLKPFGRQADCIAGRGSAGSSEEQRVRGQKYFLRPAGEAEGQLILKRRRSWEGANAR
jgi:hypothetical protein